MADYDTRTRVAALIHDRHVGHGWGSASCQQNYACAERYTKQADEVLKLLSEDPIEPTDYGYGKAIAATVARFMQMGAHRIGAVHATGDEIRVEYRRHGGEHIELREVVLRAEDGVKLSDVELGREPV